MTAWNSPATARRWLAYELRRLREDRRLAQKDVGKACGWSGVRVSYLEKWDHAQRIFDRDLDKLLPLYAVSEADRPRYYEAATASREKGWWERYGDDVVPLFLAQYVGLEQGASVIRTIEPNIVPGLLQTRDYIQSTLGTDDIPWRPSHREDIANVRVARQGAVVRDDDPLELRVVIDESVIRRIAGGPDTMANQMSRLIEMAALPNVDLRIYPFSRGLHPGMAMTYRALEFAHGEPGLVYVEHRNGASFLEDVHDVDQHVRAFEDLAQLALRAEDATAMLRDAERAYRTNR
jgi:transcriptional regulator with XRE-family HTH domain